MVRLDEKKGPRWELAAPRLGDTLPRFALPSSPRTESHVSNTRAIHRKGEARVSHEVAVGLPRVGTSSVRCEPLVDAEQAVRLSAPRVLRPLKR